jgi:hypothetical protein
MIRVQVISADYTGAVFHVGTMLAPADCNSEQQAEHLLAIAREQWREDEPEPDCDDQFIDYAIRKYGFVADPDFLLAFDLDA